MRRHTPPLLGSTVKRSALMISLAAILLVSQFNLPAQARTSPAHESYIGGDIVKPGFADLIAAIKPAVVNISTSGKVRNRSTVERPNFQFPPGSPFEDFFDRFYGDRDFSHNEGRKKRQPPARKTQALGSGFIISDDGYVVTNNHVIENADEIEVITQDGTHYPATLKGTDSKTDLAVLKIESKKPLPYVEFGDSDRARVGDWILAIGNPFGLGGTATTGIISARGRDINTGPLDDYLQIDAPINRGNSGGPLFDTSGRVIGINTAIYSPNGGSVGIGFAIPSSMAKSVITQLKNKGHVDRGWLGVQIQTVTDDLAESLGLDEKQGALVADVVKDSPAERAGVKVGDVILGFNGKPVKKMRDLPRLVADIEAGSKIHMLVLRNGKEKSLTASIGESPADEQVASLEVGRTDSETPTLGLSLASLTDDRRRQYRIDKKTNGVLVVKVDRAGPAAEKGVRTGDVIKKVGSTVVTKPQDVIDAVKKLGDSDRVTVLLLLTRDGNDQFIAIRLT